MTGPDRHRVAAVAHHFLSPVAPAVPAALPPALVAASDPALAALVAVRLQVLADAAAGGDGPRPVWRDAGCPHRLARVGGASGAVLICCLHACEATGPAVASLGRRLGAAIAPARLDVLIVPDRWRPGRPRVGRRPPAVRELAVSLQAAVPEIPVAVTAAGWPGADLLDVLRRLAGVAAAE